MANKVKQIDPDVINRTNLIEQFDMGVPIAKLHYEYNKAAEPDILSYPTFIRLLKEYMEAITNDGK